MIIGVPKEIKSNEYRVGLSPQSARELVLHGHEVLIEHHAGSAIGFTDEDYLAAGAQILGTAEEVFEFASLIVKVKEPQAIEYERLQPGQTLFTYLHLAPDPKQAEGLRKSGATCIAYETVTDPQGGLPLLAPMSEVAGRMAVQTGAQSLEKQKGGPGILLGGVPGVAPANVLILGGGVVGTNAAKMAIGMGANVTLMDKSLPRLRYLDDVFSGRVRLLYSKTADIEAELPHSDLVIGAVLLPGAAAPKLITREMLGMMRAGSVLVDVAIDQGGCFETSRPTTHADPTYLVDGIIHYCVANIPGTVARTATLALNNATIPFTLALANKGIIAALQADPHLMNGLNVHAGHITCPAVAEALKVDFVPPGRALALSNL